jgi:hypothetical protein
MGGLISPGIFTQIRPVWIGELETRPKLQSLSAFFSATARKKKKMAIFKPKPSKC